MKQNETNKFVLSFYVFIKKVTFHVSVNNKTNKQTKMICENCRK